MIQRILKPQPGMLKMVIIPGGEEFARLTMAAYYMAKKGVIDFQTFLLELKAQNVIDDITSLTSKEKLTLKEAFEQGKQAWKEEVKSGVSKYADEVPETSTLKPKENDNLAQSSLNVSTLGNLDFAAMDLPQTLQHIKFRDFTVPRKNGIGGGCHDAVEFGKIRQVNEIGFVMPIGKTTDEVPEVIISSITNHPTVPGVKIVDYKIPALDAQLKTTGNLKSVDPKTIYDPLIWTDPKLEKALKEAMQNSADANSGVLMPIWEGKTIEDYVLRGYYRNDKVPT